MRVPDHVSECVIFMCVDDGGAKRAVGTGFFVGVPSSLESSPGASYAHMYLVTARHIVEGAKRTAARLFIRVNLKDGAKAVGGEKVDYVAVDNGWLYPDNDTADVAVLRCPLTEDRFSFRVFPYAVSVTDQAIADMNIGIGDDLFLVGLFAARTGEHRNVPILRTGVIAAMPDELLVDQDSGLPYRGYLVEIRSIRGLSGSPVFVLRAVEQENVTAHARQYAFLLLGSIRSHWFYSKGDGVGFDDSSEINLGIAAVTPSQDMRSIIDRDDLVKERQVLDHEFQEKGRRYGQTLDVPIGQWKKAHKKVEKK